VKNNLRQKNKNKIPHDDKVDHQDQEELEEEKWCI
jgi:hypothetical protein